jgi:hypothetical protein
MAKKKPADRAHVFTLDEIAAVERQLKLAGEVFADFRKLAETTESKTLAAHNRLTLERALGALESSVGAIQKAIWLHRAGTPLEPGQLKPRSPWRNTQNDKPNGKPNGKPNKPNPK